MEMNMENENGKWKWWPEAVSNPAHWEFSSKNTWPSAWSIQCLAFGQTHANNMERK